MTDFSFTLPMTEAADFWREKLHLSPSEFAALTDEAKVLAFAVTGIAKGEELTTVYTALQDALNKGITFEEWKKQAADVFERRGWTGQKAWRLDTIFRTNIQTAYNVGRYQQMMRATAGRPYWRYSAVNDRRTRPAHRAMHGRIFPADHPIWDTWYPPNGFRCRCSVNSVSQDNLDANGWSVETRDPTGKLYEPTDPDTGVRMPARLLMPDPGFIGNPGKDVWGNLVSGGTQGPFKDIVNLAMKTPANYRRRALANVRPADIPDITTQPLKRGLGDAAYLDEFRKRYGESTVLTDPLKESVILSLRSFQVYKEPGMPQVFKFDKPGHGESIPLLREMVEEPYEIWLTPQRNESGRIRLAKRYISLWKDHEGKIGGIAMFEVSGGAFRGVTSYLPLKKGSADLEYLEKQRRGLLLWPKR